MAAKALQIEQTLSSPCDIFKVHTIKVRIGLHSRVPIRLFDCALIIAHRFRFVKGKFLLFTFQCKGIISPCGIHLLRYVVPRLPWWLPFPVACGAVWVTLI